MMSLKGLARSWGCPSTVTEVAAVAAAAVKKRLVVPDMRASITASELGCGAPPTPTTVNTSLALSAVTSAPNIAMASHMAAVSSAKSAPSIRVVPEARAAHSRARLVMLFDPGRLTVASGRAPRTSICIDR